ncbi:Putative fatty acid hydroxylase [Septoria linicola]|uniref:Fatty acid hydroxylase n=1 Tax=Septoria linicola TaxID=215465 RepID=A0A9Q9EQ91_9PEZI|nr:putative fatty acid hydroxylase [Septoria linicola]USW58547.1 Putative fatty acid hydroxylase [Septoria linicola]
MGVERNPKDSMKSTWRADPSKTGWTFHHHLYNWLSMNPSDLDRPTPVHQKTDKMPYIPDYRGHEWILPHALWPLALHQLYTSYYSSAPLPWPAAFIFYSLAFKLNAIHEINMIRELGHTYGFLDGDKHPRDEVPDVGVKKVFRALSSTSTFRPLMTVFLAYRTSISPWQSLSLFWLPLELGLYGIVLDFYFYWYHRIMHESTFLWKFHRTHHLTKHPSPLLTLYADLEQEIFDIAIIPLLTYATLKFVFFLPMGFSDWWICHQYIVFTELFGHSGLRVYTTPPSTNAWFLRLFDAELCTEDHDLHHRQGWKKSHNYGKQTLLWDRVFGTCGNRIEMKEGIVDWERKVVLPLI